MGYIILAAVVLLAVIVAGWNSKRGRDQRWLARQRRYDRRDRKAGRRTACFIDDGA